MLPNSRRCHAQSVPGQQLKYRRQFFGRGNITQCEIHELFPGITVLLDRGFIHCQNFEIGNVENPAR